MKTHKEKTYGVYDVERIRKNEYKQGRADTLSKLRVWLTMEEGRIHRA